MGVDRSYELVKTSCSGKHLFKSFGENSSCGHKLATEVGSSLGELSSPPRHDIRRLIDAKFRWFPSNVNPSVDN